MRESQSFPPFYIIAAIAGSLIIATLFIKGNLGGKTDTCNAPLEETGSFPTFALYRKFEHLQYESQELQDALKGSQHSAITYWNLEKITNGATAASMKATSFSDYAALLLTKAQASSASISKENVQEYLKKLDEVGNKALDLFTNEIGKPKSDRKEQNLAGFLNFLNMISEHRGGWGTPPSLESMLIFKIPGRLYSIPIIAPGECELKLQSSEGEVKITIPRSNDPQNGALLMNLTEGENYKLFSLIPSKLALGAEIVKQCRVESY